MRSKPFSPTALRTRVRGLCLGAALCGFLSAPVLAAPPSACEAPGELLRVDQSLSRTAASLVKDRKLKIVALGSSSTAGAGASGPAQSYPARLEVELRSRLIGVEVTVVNRGVNGEDAAEMLARLDEDVIAERPDLVLWQVGTNAVLNNLSLESQAPLIRAGVDRMKAAGADVVLIDSQYAPGMLAKPDGPAMLGLLEQVAKERGTGIFHRFAIMRHWHDVQHISVAEFISDDGLHMNDWSYGCTAQLLTAALLDAAKIPLVAARDRSRAGG